MAAGIVYLDVDDEITSAAARIRSSTSTKVALVVPYGSRIATSRMNFRLLSREAIVSNRRLSIVAGDAASRSLAASAGLPVFATVAEYETATSGGSGDSGPGGAGGVAAALVDDDDEHRSNATTLAESATVAAVGGAVAAGAAGAAAAPARSPRLPVDDDTARMVVPAAAAAVAATAPTAAAVAVPRPATPRDDAWAPGEDAESSARRGRSRTPLVAAVALLGLALIVLAVGAYLLLPSATIALTPKRDTISVDLTVSADPNATAVDAATATIPATRIDVPAQVTQTFTTTGVHVEQTTATGSVTFTNYDPTASNTIPRGAIVSTEGGIRFRTLATIVVPAASFTPPSTTVPSTKSVSIEAVKPGTEGNVPANAIDVVPPGENPVFLQVANPNPTTGGTHTETPEVSKAEVDKAVAQLQAQLDAAFRDAVTSGAGAPAGATVFPDTAVPGVATPSPDPKTLVGQAVPSFDLTLSSTGSAIAVDPTPVRQIAEQQLMGKVGSDHRLVDGSTQIQVGDGTVGADGSVSFPARATAERVLIVDPAQLRGLVKGRTKAEAEAALAPFGTVRVALWPDWVTTVTGVDGRLDLTVDDSATASAPASVAPTESSGPSGVPRPSGAPRPSGSAHPGGSARPGSSARPAESARPTASGDAGSAAP
jgi:hypothetical protein